MKNRLKFIESCKDEADLLIIGGGINGAGIFRDASLRGLKTVLIEKNEYSSGTSSRSSKMIHGGLRYLENLDFPLVMESCLERAKLVKLFPDLVKPQKFIMPVYKDDRYGVNYLNLGMWLYDILALYSNYKNHKKLSINKTIEESIELNTTGLNGSLSYYDATINDAKFVINNIFSGIKAGGSANNYTEFISVIKENSKIVGALVRDCLNREEYEIRAKNVIFATGPWTNDVYKDVENVRKDVLRLTKGIHLIFPKDKFITKSAVVMTSNDDKRIVFVVPFENYTLVGTTDTDYNDTLENIVANVSDVAYLIKLINEKFPKINIKAEDAISVFAGVRPLLLKEGSASTISRKDKIISTKNGLHYIGGGKLTTYRNISEKAVNKIVKNLKKDGKISFKKCETSIKSLINTYDIEDSSLIPYSDIRNYLAKTYGSDAKKILNICVDNHLLAGRIDFQFPHIYAELVFAFRYQQLLSLSDFFRYRTELFLKSKDNALSVAEKCAEILAKEFNLESFTKEKLLAEYKTYVNENLFSIGRKC